MEITVNRERFLEALEGVKDAISKRSVRPILKSVCIQVTENPHELEIQGTDLELAIKYRVHAEEIKSGAPFCISHMSLLKILKSCTDEIVLLEVSGKKATLKSGFDSYEFEVFSIDDFPNLPDMRANLMVLEASIFSEMLKRVQTVVAGAGSKVAQRVAGCVGILIQVKDKQLEMAGTHGVGLAYCKVKIKSAVVIEEALLPVCFSQAVQKVALKFKKHVVELGVLDRHVFARIGPVTVYSLLLEAKFPTNFKAVIPRDYNHDASVRCDALQKALLKLVNVNARSAELTIEQERAASMLTLCSVDAEVNTKIVLPCEFSGSKFSSKLRYEVLLDWLRGCSPEYAVRVEWGDLDNYPLLWRQGTDSLLVLAQAQ